jgi:acylglycerol lipase
LQLETSQVLGSCYHWLKFGNRKLKESGLLSPISMFPSAGDFRNKSTVDWLTAPDGTALGFRHWQASPQAPVVVYLHGIEGHSQWFSRTADLLNKRDTAIYALDRRGSGMNREHPGHLKDHKAYLADLETALQLIQSRHPHQPIILLANCWSARAAALIACQNYKPITKTFDVKLAGLIFTSPAIYSKIDLDLRTKYKIARAWFKGGNSLKKNWPIPLKPSFFTNNPAYLSYVQDDPWRLKEATAGFFIATAIFSWLAKRTAPFISLPLLVIQSGADQIVDVAKTQKWYNQVKSEEKAMHIFPGVFHSIDFDDNCFRQYTDILSRWLKTR